MAEITAPPSGRSRSRQLIKSFQAKALRRRPFPIRFADVLTTYFGSLQFLILNLIGFIFWIFINTGLIPGIAPFDPFPFILLTMIVSLEAIVLTVIVLMSQNRTGYIATIRDDLDLQVNLIEERELTKALQLLMAIHDHLGISRESDPELDSMLKYTNVSYIEHKLEEQIRGQSPTLPQVMAAPFRKVSQAVKTMNKNNNNKNRNGKGNGKK